jgi:hypothetical protein
MTSAAHWRKSTRRKWEFDRIYSMQTSDFSDVQWVERYTVGISHPERYLTQNEINKQMDEVNRALRYGKLIAVEQNFTLLSCGGKDIITQYTVYHVGFKHRPPGK